MPNHLKQVHIDQVMKHKQETGASNPEFGLDKSGIAGYPKPDNDEDQETEKTTDEKEKDKETDDMEVDKPKEASDGEIIKIINIQSDAKNCPTPNFAIFWKIGQF